MTTLVFDNFYTLFNEVIAAPVGKIKVEIPGAYSDMPCMFVSMNIMQMVNIQNRSAGFHVMAEAYATNDDGEYHIVLVKTVVDDQN